MKRMIVIVIVMMMKIPEETAVQCVVFDGRNTGVCEMETNLGNTTITFLRVFMITLIRATIVTFIRVSIITSINVIITIRVSIINIKLLHHSV